MKVGDLVFRKTQEGTWKDLGIVLSKQLSGERYLYPCVTVYYMSSSRTYDMAEAIMEVVNESR